MTAPTTHTALGIIAGGGALPGQLVRQAQANGQRFFVVRLAGHYDDPFLDQCPGITAQPAQLGRIFVSFKAQGLHQLVIIGRVKRPSIWELRPDWTALCLLPRLIPLLTRTGDDGLLKGLRGILEEKGFTLTPVQAVLKDIVGPAGVLGRWAAPADRAGDIAKGMDAALTLGRLDIGQSVVVQQGVILGVEGVEGTDALIDRCAGLKRPGPGPILVKCAKPGQDTALDMPTLGPSTVRHAAKAGFAGIVYSGGACLMVEAGDMVTLADEAQIFIEGREVP